jgi:hypothetical protein
MSSAKQQLSSAPVGGHIEKTGSNNQDAPRQPISDQWSCRGLLPDIQVAPSGLEKKAGRSKDRRPIWRGGTQTRYGDRAFAQKKDNDINGQVRLNGQVGESQEGIKLLTGR